MREQALEASRSGAKGFTLIELLIVVAIIAILAAIAVPNFLEAQTRAKVSRVRADLRTVATGLEAYRTDANAYPPNDGNFNVLPIQLTTPVAFLTTSRFMDPFTDKDIHPTKGDLVKFYTYHKIVDYPTYQREAADPSTRPAYEAVDAPLLNPGALTRYGGWLILSYGPDRRYSRKGESGYEWGNPLYDFDMLYDPTNGTLSFGNLIRTQRSPEGRSN